ncbi:LuxR family transcriptional regulator [Vibrio sp. qd031]|uniref:sigma-54-dependent transcriptional regulator n=1 Tax=Vibrio sp. qd031 TaxID=1603038 RepID=UPI000A11CA22|nr:sigma-54 dependent transcriptional regulator [Vibrio sp. qd031]ORT49614.1 LuxR family transcriptional regulator [Vibrio sp. qd031]
MRPKVLLVEDSNSLAILYQQYVKDEPYDLFRVDTGEKAKAFIRDQRPALIILDLKLPDTSGEEILDWIVAEQLPTSVIVATAHGSVDIAVTLIQKGANDFLEKPIQAERLKTSIALHLKQSKLEKLITNFETKFDRHNFHGFIGSSLPMQAVYKTIESAAPTTASIFINGESGTGKEVCAEAIHKQSTRAKRPFVAINCGAIPKDLMESEIFGHIKGAFTGATSDRKGAAQQADGGTLFLDELCEMELEMQKKLLRFLQTGRFTPLGGSKEIQVDLRILCATNRDPMVEVREGRFREDLYYRVHVIPIDMPPLRERGKDIITLAEHFVKLYAKQDGKQFSKISSNVKHVMSSYSWPGNVRQLQNIVRNIIVLNDGKTVELEHLPPPLNQQTATGAKASEHAKSAIIGASFTESIVSPAISPPTVEHNTPLGSIETLSADVAAPKPSAEMLDEPLPPSTPRPVRPMWEVERETIQNAIAYCDGNVINAAVLLDLSPATVYRKKQQWEAQESEIE